MREELRGKTIKELRALAREGKIKSSDVEAWTVPEGIPAILHPGEYYQMSTIQEDGVSGKWWLDKELKRTGQLGPEGVGNHAALKRYIEHLEKSQSPSTADHLRDANPWRPTQDLLELAHLGKFLEELGEAVSASARVIIQGIDACEPVTGKSNRLWLTEEVADVMNTAGMLVRKYKLDEYTMGKRIQRKEAHLSQWHALLLKMRGYDLNMRSWFERGVSLLQDAAMPGRRTAAGDFLTNKPKPPADLPLGE